MTLIEQKTLTHAMRMLDAIGLEYAIKDMDGKIHGTLASVKEPKRKLSYPFGTIMQHIKQYIHDDFGVGQIAIIPIAPFDRETLSRSCGTYMIRKYGAGSFKTCLDKETNSLEIVRYF